MRKKLASLTLMAGVAMGLAAPPAHADGLSRCEFSVGFWLFKGTNRMICDGVRRPDGSWLRVREFYTPEHYKPLTTYCSGGRYYSSCTTSGGYWVPRASSGQETYVVFDYNVLPDEPGHLD